MSTVATIYLNARGATTALDEFWRRFLSVRDWKFSSHQLKQEARLTERGRAGFETQVVEHALQSSAGRKLVPTASGDRRAGNRRAADRLGVATHRLDCAVLPARGRTRPCARSATGRPSSPARRLRPRPKTAIRASEIGAHAGPAQPTVSPHEDDGTQHRTSPTECQTFMGLRLQIAAVSGHSAQIPSYIEWLNHKADLVPTYRYVKRVLKLLQWHCPPNAGD